MIDGFRNSHALFPTRRLVRSHQKFLHKCGHWNYTKQPSSRFGVSPRVSSAQVRSKSFRRGRRNQQAGSLCFPELFLGGNQFLEALVLAQRFKHWIQPEKRRRKRWVCG